MEVLVRDPKSLTDSLEGFDPISETQKAKARITVCHHCDDAAAAKDLMYMLGIFPGQRDEVVDMLPLPRVPAG